MKKKIWTMMKNMAICNLLFHLDTTKHIKVNDLVVSDQLMILMMVEESSLLKKRWRIQIFYVLTLLILLAEVAVMSCSQM
jgi:hypothetical protein